MSQSFRNLRVWQRSMSLVTDIYNATQSFPATETFGLSSQIRRSAVSIPSNIAEGFGTQLPGDYVRFLTISRGSLFELHTQLEIALNLELLSKDTYDQLSHECHEISRMLSSLISKVRNANS